MRAIYVLLVAATSYLASSAALPLAMDSNEAQISQLTSFGQNNAQAKRFLRTDKVTEDEERGKAWANILGIERTKADAIDVMGDWLKRVVSPAKVAEHLKVSSYDKKNENFNALVEYVRMTHYKWKGEALSEKAAKAYVKSMFKR